MLNKNNCFHLLLFGFLILFLSSCKTLNLGNDDIDMTDLPKWAVSFNEVIKYPRATLGEKEVSSQNGKPLWVRKHSELYSRTIKEIIPVPTDNPDEFNLKMDLNKQGAMIAMRLCNEKIHPPWGILIDGVYFQNVEFKKADGNDFDDYSEVIVTGPFKKEVAEALAKYSVANYEYLNKGKDEKDMQ